MTQPTTTQTIQKIRKRDGSLTDFDQSKITSAILKAILATQENESTINEEENQKLAQRVCDKVVALLQRRFREEQIPEVEQVQDIIEEVLMLEELVEAAKAFILYREQRRQIREGEIITDEAVEIFEKYIGEMDWRVKENANMAYSLQGLNHYAVSVLTKRYWLNKIYPKYIREAYTSGDMHIHDLDCLATYCNGWDLYDLLLRGFGGVAGKVETSPAKHFGVALGQIVNFFYTLQGECFSKDTEVLTNFGWKYFYEVAKTDKIYTLNNRTNQIELQEPLKFYEFDFNGELYNFKTKKLDLMVTPNHNMVVDQYCPNCSFKQLSRFTLNDFETDNFGGNGEVAVLSQTKNQVFSYQPFYSRRFVLAKDFDADIHLIPYSEKKFTKLKFEKLSKEKDIKKIKYNDKVYCLEVPNHTLYVRRNGKACWSGNSAGAQAMSSVDTLLAPFIRHDKLDYPQVKQAMQEFLFNCAVPTRVGFQCLSEDTEILTIRGWKIYQEVKEGEIIKTFNLNSGKIEDKVVNSVFKKDYEGIMYSLKGKKQDQLVSPGHRIVIKQNDGSFIVQPIENVLSLNSAVSIPIFDENSFEIETEKVTPQCISKVDYKGIIWCPNTANETVIAKRNDQVFITGNTPFSNVTLDIHPSPSFAKQPVIIGGAPQQETYAEFQDEMNMFNNAFFEVMMQGDKNGRPFTFPIPTINITKDFPWDDPKLDLMWKATAKYGISYFANFIHSDMKPEDVRSMCKLPHTQIIYKNATGEIAKTEIRRIVDDFMQRGNRVEILINGKFKPVKSTLKLRIENADILKLKLDNGLTDSMTLDHPSMIIKDGELILAESRDLKIGDEFPISKHSYNGDLGDFDLGRVVGLYIGDGWISHNGATVNFVFSKKEKDLIDFIDSINTKRFAATTNIIFNDKHNYCKISVASRPLAEIIKEYTRGDGSLEKRINSKAFARSIEFRKGVIIGVIESDGSVSKRKDCINLHLGNRKLILDILMLARTLGVNTTYFESKNKTGNKEKIAYTLRFAQDTPDWCGSYFKLDKGKNLKYKEYKDFYGVKIVDIKKVKYTGYVYDFEIESEEHLFQLANGIITHNCCRLRIDNTELHKRGGGLFGANPLTGSCGVVTINLPRIGYLTKTRKELFEKLAKIMDIARDSLEIKRKALEDLMRKGLYPYSRVYLSGIEKMRRSYFSNHFSTIGIVGLNECLLNFMGEDIGSKNGRVLALEVLDFMRERIINYQKETNNLYNLEATPAEGVSYRLPSIDVEKYPGIITAGAKDSPYYTNSSHLPVNYTDDIFKVLELQDDLQCKYTGGCIEKGNNILTNKGLLTIDSIVENFKKLRPIKALSYNPLKRISEWDEITDAMKIDVAKHNKIRVKGERGLDITTSDWHPFFVMEKVGVNPHCPMCEERVGNVKGFAVHLRWNQECRNDYQNISNKYKVIEKRADELKEGDYILQNSFNLYQENLTELNNDLMWFLGFFIGDGCISRIVDNRGGNSIIKYKVRFFSEHQEVLEKLTLILNRYFNCRVSIIKNDKRSERLREVSAGQKNVVDFLFKYGFKDGKKVYNVSVDWEIKKNFNKENVFAFLSGLMDSDGHISKRDGDFEYYTVSSKLAEDLLEICTQAGLMVAKSLKKTKRENETDIWRLRIPQYGVTKIRECLFNVVNRQNIRSVFSNRKKRYLPIVRVEEISKVNVEDNQFYDLTTKNNHNYLAGKNCLVFVHNTVQHLFLGEQITDIANMKALIKKIFENFRLPYITLTPTFSICPTHGYLSGEHWKCPKCTVEQACEVYSRVVGYIRPVQQFHKGKQQEFKERKTYQVPNVLVESPIRNVLETVSAQN